jgi:hypothetical protein
MRWSFLLERVTVRRLKEQAGNRQLQHIKRSLLRNNQLGFHAKISRLCDPEHTDEIDKNTGRLRKRYVAQLNVSNNKITPATEDDALQIIIGRITHAAEAKEWRFLEQIPYCKIDKARTQTPADTSVLSHEEQKRDEKESCKDAEGHVTPRSRQTESGAHLPLLKEWRFPLRSGLDVSLSLPSDVTVSEAQRLAAFVQALPC